LEKVLKIYHTDDHTNETEENQAKMSNAKVVLADII
jgi:hypothetical protein